MLLILLRRPDAIRECAVAVFLNTKNMDYAVLPVIPGFIYRGKKQNKLQYLECRISIHLTNYDITGTC